MFDLVVGWFSYPVVADVVQAFRDSSFWSGKVIVVILILASIVAWSVMWSKYLELRAAQTASERFLIEFRRRGDPMALFLENRSFPESPLYHVYVSACHVIAEQIGAQSSSRWLGPTANPSVRLSTLQVEMLRQVADRTVADQALKLERRMGHLMLAVSISPMLGLLGTVWGVLDAFAAMAHKGAANLAAVAPGVSAALLTTVVGLLVAIPSSIGYNLLASRIRTLVVQMDNFAQELAAAVQLRFSGE
jgi:biopolymer transport protein ExbB/TolQ